MELAVPSRNWLKLPLDFFMTLWTPLLQPDAARSSCISSQRRASVGTPRLQQPMASDLMGRRGGAEISLRQPARMVRVIQVLDPSQPRGGLGRIRISGTMDEVCAELDRLA